MFTCRVARLDPNRCGPRVSAEPTVCHGVKRGHVSARLTGRFFINFKKERALTDLWRENLSIKYADQSDPVDRLSGGNQQKTVLAKWLATDPDLLIVDEPTRGIDVGTKAEVHRLIDKAAGEGKAILMISSELPEVLGMADRIIVMREGRQVTELSRKEATQENVIAAATTGKKGI